jgi:hypothetical protein
MLGHPNIKDSFHQHSGLRVKEETGRCYTWGVAVNGTETGTLQKVDQKYLDSFEM